VINERNGYFSSSVSWMALNCVRASSRFSMISAANFYCFSSFLVESELSLFGYL
jgi:hypothetical protein